MKYLKPYKLFEELELLDRGYSDNLKDAFKNEYLDIEELERELISPVKKKKMKLEILSLEEAMTQMELIGHDFFIYKNEDNLMSVLYLRDDGKYGLIETE